MNQILILFLSMSFSGSLLILVLFLFRPLYKNRTSRRWQYYAWLIVIARLLLPFSPKQSFCGMMAERAGQMVLRISSAWCLEGTILGLSAEDSSFTDTGKYATEQENTAKAGNHTAGQENAVAAVEKAAGQENAAGENSTGQGDVSARRNAAAAFLTDTVIKITPHLWLAWIGIAALLLIRKITIYQNFIQFMRASREEIADTGLLDKLAQIGEQAGVKRPVELYVNRFVSSPLLVGFSRPGIILPSADISDTDFLYTVWHELTHYKQRDMLYKWLMQITVCLHWFNPLVWLMSRELGRACELACDEAVIRSLDPHGRRAYGDTLLHAFETGGSYKSPVTSVTLTESAKQLEERLGAIMKYKKNTKFKTMLSASLTTALICGAAAAGAAVPVKASRTQTGNSGTVETIVSDGTIADPAQTAAVTSKKSGSFAASQAETYYQEGNLEAFKEAFSSMNEADQEAWLKKIYKDGKIAFFAISLQQLDESSPLPDSFAKIAYQEKNISFFSVLTDHMDRKSLKSWLEKAEKDKQNFFQMVLMNALDMDRELDEKRSAEYQKYGITRKGKSYYYKGKQVRYFLDMQNDSSFYTFSMNPNGTVNVKITRDEDGNIQSAKRISDTQARKLLKKYGYADNWMEEPDQLDELDQYEDQMNQLEDSEDDLTKAGGVKYTVPVSIDKVKDGEFVWLGTYELAENDKIYYRVSAETGKRLDIGFAKPGDKNPDITYHMVSNQRTDGKLEVRSSGFWKKPLKSGKYRLFIHTRGTDLKKVTGTVVL